MIDKLIPPREHARRASAVVHRSEKRGVGTLIAQPREGVVDPCCLDRDQASPALTPLSTMRESEITVSV